jgi:hypothetical protein
MRALTRPEGKEAVERQAVSGWCTPFCCAVVNQLWNWIKGEEWSSWSSERAPLVYWSAWELVLSLAGETVNY